MAPPDPNQRTQEQSIKARKHQLFESDEHATQLGGSSRSFADCLRETPADPLSPSIKAGLWVVGALVMLLLLAAFTRVGARKPRPKPNPTALVHPGLTIADRLA